MSLPWHRIGEQIETTPWTPPGTVTAAFFVNYRSASGLEELAYTYNATAQTFTAVSTAHVSISSAANLFTVTIDTTLALRVTNGILSVNGLTERAAPAGAAAIFYTRTQTGVKRLATLTKLGVLSVPRITESATITPNVNSFRISNNATLTVMIDSAGLHATSLKEPIV